MDFCGISMIQHTVSFRLKHPVGSEAEAAFLREAQALAKLPGVLEFRILKQLSSKSPFNFALSMYFSSEESYASYDAHPEHQAFVKEAWARDVEDYMELDYVEYVPR